MNYRVWGIPAVLSRQIPGNAQEKPPKIRKSRLNLKEEKPPKIRRKKKSSQELWNFFFFFFFFFTERTEKIGKIKGTLVRKVPGNLRSQEFVFFSCAVFLPPIERLKTSSFRLKFSILTLRFPHENRGLVGGPLGIFNLA